jgi:acetyltransferase-like isoleucine patch superfamily enzyme
MSACVAKDTEPWSVYAGVPAKKVKTIKRELSVVS